MALPLYQKNPDDPQRTMVAALHDHVLAAVQEAPEGGLVMELGCGSGVLTLRMAEIRPDLRIIAIDPGSDLIRKATAAATEAGHLDRVRFERSELWTLPQSDATVDLLIGVTVLSCCSHPQAVLSETSRVLLLGGRALFPEAVPETGRSAPQRGPLYPTLTRPGRTETTIRSYVSRSPLRDHTEFTRFTIPSGDTFLEVLCHAPPPPDPPKIRWRFGHDQP